MQRSGIAGELDVGDAVNRMAAVETAHVAVALPIRDAQLTIHELLIAHHGSDGDVDAFRWNAHAPAARVDGAGVRALPRAQRLRLKIAQEQMPNLTVARDEAAARLRGRTA